MGELRDLYQEVILEHSKGPRNYRQLAGANQHAEGYNPLCGDHFTVYLNVEGDRIRDIAFQGSGCAISKASASLMTESVKGRKRTEATALLERFQRLITSPPDSPIDHLDHLGKLAAFAGVRQFPARVKCASLAWHTLRAALDSQEEVVSTE